MPQHRDNNRLSTGDALFLYLEREGMPLNVASVSVFEGKISLAACTRFIESKLPLIPRYRQRVVAPPFNIGLPLWEYDPDFDIHYHVRHLTLKHGTDAELKAEAGKILSKMMDRQRPLWDFTLLHGLKGNRTGVVTRMHHCLADGLAGVSLMNVLMDASPEVRPHAPDNSQPHAAPRTKTPKFLDELISSSFSIAERVLKAQTEFLDVLQHALASAGHGTEEHAPHAHAEAGFTADAGIPSMAEFTRFMPELTSTTQRLPFNTVCRGPQEFRWAQIPLAEIKAVKDACGATVNDVVLAVVISAIRRYVELRGVRVRGRLLRIVVPVNVRGNGKVKVLGNRITFLPVTIPLDIRNPRKLVTAIRERMAFLKNAHVAEFVGMFGTVLGAIPTAAQVLVGPIVSQLPLGLGNIICTNVPGPQFPLYLLGHKMLRCYPYVPIGGDLGLNCAVLTYDGTAYFGFSGNAEAAPGLGRLERFLIASFAELRKSVGVGPRRPRRGRSREKEVTNSTPSPAPDSAAPPVNPRPPQPAQTPKTTEPSNSEPPIRLAV